MQQLRKNRNNMPQGVKKDATCNIQQCCVRLCTGRPNIVGCYMLRPFAHPQGTPCCKMLHVVASCCCAKFETRKTFSYVQTDATTFNIAGRCCVRLYIASA